MLKKTLLALAIASVAGAANAAVVHTAPAVLSIQGAVATGKTNLDGSAYTTTKVGDIAVTLKGEYKQDDIITLTFSGADLDDATAVTASAVLKSATFDSGSGTPTLQPVGTMTLGLLNVTGNVATFRVTDLSYANGVPAADATTVDGELTFSGFVFKTASILSSKSAKVVYSAQTATGGFALDSAKTNTATLFTAADQFVGKVSGKLDAVIDVDTKRLTFISDAVKDEATVGLTEAKDAENNAISFSQQANLADSKLVINGNFGFLEDTSDTTDGIQTTKVSAMYNGDPATVKVFADHLEVTPATAQAANYGDYVVSVDVSSVKDPSVAAAALSAQKFTAGLEADYTDSAATAGKVTLLSSADAGQWTLNGALVHVPYMPFRAGYSPIVNISNTSTQDGDVEVLVYSASDKWAAPKSYTLPVAAKAQAQTNITSALQAAGISGDVAMDIVVNAPAASIAVNALYYNNGDRAVINTEDRSSNVK